MKKLFDKMYKDSAKSFYEILSKNLKDEKRMFVVTANPETFMISDTDKEMEKLLCDKKTVIVPDGIGVVKASHMLGLDVKERITGVDIAAELLKLGDEQNKSIYLFGSKQEVIASLTKVIEENYPNLNIAGATNGYEKEKDKLFSEAAKTNPDIILVALGIPNQEKIIYRHLEEFKKGIFVGVGGTFDVLSGYKKRAPKIFINLNLEWLYRIMKEPKRFKRFWNNNVKFLLKIRKER